MKNAAILWQLSIPETKNTAFMYSVLGVLLILFGVAFTPEGESFWNFITSIGISFSLIGFFYTVMIFQSKKKYFKYIREYAEQLVSKKSTLELIVTDDVIVYKDFQTNAETKWSYYLKYKLLKDAIVIYTDTYREAAVVVNKSELTEASFLQLTEFLKNKFG